MAVRFQADADLNQIIVSAVVRHEPAIDFRTALEADLAGVADQEVLALAARDGRLLVTHDRATMPRHFREFVRSQHSAGVIVISARPSDSNGRGRLDFDLDRDERRGMEVELGDVDVTTRAAQVDGDFARPILLRAIQELAGHVDLATTQRYMHLSPAAIEGAIRLLDQAKPMRGLGDILETDATRDH